MSDGVRIKIEEDVTPTLKEISRRAGNLRPVMPALAAIMVDSIQENFQQEGRPEKWQSLKKPRPGYKILTGSGRLRHSVHTKFSDTQIEAGTNVSYAAVHNCGYNKTQQVKSHSRTISQVFGRSITPKTITVKSFSRRMLIPKREFMLIQTEDLREMEQTAGDFIVPKVK